MMRYALPRFDVMGNRPVTGDVVGVHEDEIGEVAVGGSRGNVINVVSAGGDDNIGLGEFGPCGPSR